MVNLTPCGLHEARRFYIGALRRGNKPVVEPEEEKSFSNRKTLHDIIVNGLGSALLKNIMEVFDNVKEKYK